MLPKEYTRTRNSSYNLLSGTVGQALNLLLKFVCRTIFIKTLGVSYLGINGLFSDILTLLSLGELGFDLAISYRLYKPIAEKDDVKVREYLVFFHKAYIVISIIIGIIGLLFVPFLKIFIADYDSLEAIGINATLVFVLYLLQNLSTYLFGASRSIILKAAQKQYILDIAGYIITFVSSLSQILVLLLTKNFIYYILVVTIFVILQNIINASLSKRTFPQYFVKEQHRLSIAEKKELFKDCSALFVYKINNVVMKVTDNLVLSSFLGLAIVGLYSNYLMVFMAVNGILQTIFSGLKASMGNLFVSDDDNKKYFMFEVMSFVTSSLYGIAGICIAVEINEFIRLWIGPEYEIPQPFPLLIGIEMLFTGLKLNLAQIRHISGVFKQMWYRPVIGSVINVVISIVLVRIWGISGVIIGTLSAAIFANLAVDPFLIHKYSFHGNISVWHYYRKTITFVLLLLPIGFFCYFACSSLYTGNGIFSLIVHLLFILLASLLYILILSYKRKEYQYLQIKLKKVTIRYLKSQ